MTRLRLPLIQLDAFTRRVFCGNPAAVVILWEWLPDDRLQAIAAENNLSETAFVLPDRDPCPLRWFTPTAEVDLCGHATLAAADVLFRDSHSNARRVRFETASGELVVERAADGLAMDFPSRPGVPVEASGEILEALGAKPQELLRARDLMAVFESEEQVRDFVPDPGRIAALDAFALIVTAPGGDCDFVSRFFAPKAGIPEDPATGSSHCTLAPYWAVRLGKATLRARQLSRRGAELSCRVEGDRVRIAGHVVEFMRGEIEVD